MVTTQRAIATPRFVTINIRHMITGLNLRRRRLRRRRRERAGLYYRLKTDSFVGTVTERLIVGMSTAAERNHSTAAQIVGVAFHIANRNISLNPQGAVVVAGDLSHSR